MTDRTDRLDGPGLVARRAFEGFADATRATSPLYATLARAAATDPTSARVLSRAPVDQRIPALLFAAVHWLLLRGDPHPLGDFYPSVRRRRGLVDGDTSEHSGPAAAFVDFVGQRHDVLVELVTTRSTQTNEVGRGSVVLPAVATVGRGRGPVALVDLGASAGLNLLMDRWNHRWRRLDGSVVELAGDPTVQLDCLVTGPLPLPHERPDIPWRIGIDRSPVDPTDPGAVDWLLACAWPDEPDRHARLRSAIAVAASHPTPVREGDVVADLPRLVDDVPDDLHLVLTSSWVLAYLDDRRQRSVVTLLDDIGRRRDLDLVAMESPAHTTGMPWPTPVGGDAAGTRLVRIRWRHGVRSVAELATVHPHGHWMHAAPPRPTPA